MIIQSALYPHFILFFSLTSVFGIPTSTFLKAVTVKNCGKSIIPGDFNDRIIGGENVQPGQYPWMVSIREKDDFGFDHVCGGAILNENWIITAAHCIGYSSPRRYEIYAGLHKLSQEKASTVKRYKISRIVIHNNYDDDTFESDIALLQTTKPIDISGSDGYINGICLPKSKKDPSGFATVIGWGHTKEDGKKSDTLKRVLVPVIDRSMCNEAYGDNSNEDISVFSKNMICAGMTGRDSCQYDSGGPLFQTDKSGKATLIGIVSNGAGCGAKFYPGIYTKVSMFQTWIANTVS